MAEKSPKSVARRQAVAAKAAKARAVARKVPTKRVTSKAQGFMDFVRKQGVVGLAVGLAIGTAATALVKSIVDNMVNPVVGALLPGSSDLNSKFFCVGNEGAECVNKVGYGIVLSNLISFITVALVIYFIVMGLRLDKLDKKKD
jgi:large conductance mechanosensitive channel